MFEVALNLEQRAQRLADDGRFEDAMEAYEQAVVHYERAEEQALSQQDRDGAVTARAAADEAERQAEAALAPAFASSTFAFGRRAYRAAEEHFRDEDYEEASAGFRNAETLFGRAAREATAEAARRKAPAEEARATAREGRAAADRAGAREGAGASRYAEARSLEEQGEVAFQASRFDQASRHFRDAATLYEEAIERLAAARDAVPPEKEAAIEAQRAMEEAKRRAEASPQRDDSYLRFGQMRERQALQAMEDEDFEQATRYFTDARTFYESAAGR